MNELIPPIQEFYFDTAADLITAVELEVKETEVIADIGCGIVPVSYFRPMLHIMVEPWSEYSDVLSHRYADDKSIIILKVGALEALKAFAENSVDSIFLIDVIEHLEKDDGIQVISECERVAREQIVVFTPLGFMPQSVQSGTSDAWGLNGLSVQEHRSGWYPSDFGSSWLSYICKEYHKLDYKGDQLDKPYGAFFAIRNFHNKKLEKPRKVNDIRRPLPSELKLASLNAEHTHVLLQLAAAKSQLELQMAEARSQLEVQLTEARLQCALQLSAEKSRFEIQIAEAKNVFALKLSETHSLLAEEKTRYQFLASSRPVLAANWLRRMLKLVGLRK